MEIYSGQRPARPGATLAATSALLGVALLMAFSSIQQKTRNWAVDPGQAYTDFPPVVLRLPASWIRRQLHVTTFAPGTGDHPEPECTIHRISQGRLDAEAAVEWVAQDRRLERDDPLRTEEHGAFEIPGSTATVLTIRPPDRPLFQGRFSVGILLLPYDTETLILCIEAREGREQQTIRLLQDIARTVTVGVAL